MKKDFYRLYKITEQQQTTVSLSFQIRFGTNIYQDISDDLFLVFQVYLTNVLLWITVQPLNNSD